MFLCQLFCWSHAWVWYTVLVGSIYPPAGAWEDGDPRRLVAGKCLSASELLQLKEVQVESTPPKIARCTFSLRTLTLGDAAIETHPNGAEHCALLNARAMHARNQLHLL